MNEPTIVLMLFAMLALYVVTAILVVVYLITLREKTPEEEAEEEREREREEADRVERRKKRLEEEAGKITEHAPKDESKPFAALLLSISSSDKLTHADKAAMATATNKLQERVERLAASHSCYVVPEMDLSHKDPIMYIVGLSAKNVLAVAEHVQLDSFKEGFLGRGTHCERLEKVYQDGDIDMDLDMTDYASRWNGFRIRSAIHFGHGTIKRSADMKSYSYTGRVMSEGSQLIEQARPGQLLLSGAAFSAIPNAAQDDLSVQGMNFVSPVEALVPVRNLQIRQLDSRQFDNVEGHVVRKRKTQRKSLVGPKGGVEFEQVGEEEAQGEEGEAVA